MELSKVINRKFLFSGFVRFAVLNLQWQRPESGKEPPKFYYMCYITADKVGLHQLPFDGNPNRLIFLE